MKLKKKYTGVRQPHLEHGSPRVGSWEYAEEWNYEVKEPIEQLDGYLYTIDCEIGDEVNAPSTVTYSNLKTCVFDTSTKYSSAFASTLSQSTSTEDYEPSYSSTAKDKEQISDFWSLGLSFEGTQYYDIWCLGAGDVHTTVCMDDQKFQYITKWNSRAQYEPSAAFWSDV